MSTIKKQVTGGWIDESIPKNAEKIIKEFSTNPELPEKIGRHLGSYRLCKQFHDTNPPNHQVADHLKALQGHIGKLLTGLDLLPQGFNQLMASLALRAYGGDLVEQNKRLGQLKENLSHYEVLFSHLQGEYSNAESRRGEKPKDLEKRLLSDISALIEKEDPGYGLINSAGLASKILTACGVHNIPHAPSKAREAIRNYRKRHPEIPPKTE